MLRIDVITIFPELFEPFRSTGVLGGARERGLLALEAHDLRGWTRDRHRTVDDIPYGGGPGMVMKPEPLVEAIEAVAGAKGSGRRAQVAAGVEQLVLACGRYEGVDERVIDLAVDEEISIGDYVLAGGEVAAMAVIEAVSRFVPGVLGNPDSTVSESFEQGRLEGPQYTRPVEYRGLVVPEVLRSGDHAKIARWRTQRGLERTERRRPDLLATRGEQR